MIEMDGNRKRLRMSKSENMRPAIGHGTACSGGGRREA